jgi:hypothetical protein
MSNGQRRKRIRRIARNEQKVSKRLRQLDILDNLFNIPCIRYTVGNLRGVF